MIDSFVSVVLVVSEVTPELSDYLTDLRTELASSFVGHETIVVANSRDAQTRAAALDLTDDIPDLQVFVLARRVDDNTATTAGLDAALGDVTVTASALLDPPDVIVAAASLVTGGVPVVYGADSRRVVGTGRIVYRTLGRGFARAMQLSTGLEVPRNVAGVTAVSRQVLNSWLANRDRAHLLRLMPALAGSHYSVLPYESNPTIPTPTRSVRIAVRDDARAMASASSAPIRAAWILGLIGSGLNLLYAVGVVIIALAKGSVVEGWVSLSLQAAGMFFLVFLILAIIAEYIFRLSEATHDRPIYRISAESTSAAESLRERLNLAEDASTDAAADGGR